MTRTLCIAIVIVVGFVVASGQAAEPLRLVKTIPLGNVAGRIDHMAADTAGQRLFVAALGNNTVEVVDLAAGKVAQSIPGLHEPQGLAFLKDQELIAVASGEDGTCRLFDAKTCRSTKTINFESDADNVRYDPAAKRIYVGFGAGAIGAIDAVERKHLSDVKLAGHPESFQLETRGPRIYVNVPGARQIAVIDRKNNEVAATWQVDGAQANFPMALDEPGHRLFVGCRTPAVVLVYDTQSGKVVNQFRSVGDTDDLFYDAPTQRLYVCGGEGYIFVHQKDAADRYTQLAKIPTAAGARTGLFVPDLARLFVAVPHRGSQAAELRAYEVVR